jgi:hypothetical protein
LPPLQVGNAVLIQHPASSCSWIKSWLSSQNSSWTCIPPKPVLSTSSSPSYVCSYNTTNSTRSRSCHPWSSCCSFHNGQAAAPSPAADPAPVAQVEENPPLRRSARAPKPSSLYPSHTSSE